MHRFQQRFVKNLDVIARGVLLNNTVIFLGLLLVIQQFGGESPLTLPSLTGAIFNFLFFLLCLRPFSLKIAKRTIGVLTSVVLIAYSLVPMVLALAFVVPAIEHSVPWYGWTAIAYLTVSGILSVSCGLFLLKSKKQNQTQLEQKNVVTDQNSKHNLERSLRG